MDERLKFIARLLEGEKMTPLCRESGNSRVTGYKIYKRSKEYGLDGLYDHSRAPSRQANKLPFQVGRTILDMQNGHHERTHLTHKKDATKPAAFNFLQQQERFDDFARVYINTRPHQALGGAYPGHLYTPSARAYEPPVDPECPYHDHTKRVTRCGRICLVRRKINLSVVFAEQLVGIREVGDQVWQVNCLEYDLGFFDKDQDRVEPGPEPFAPDKASTMCP